MSFVGLDPDRAGDLARHLAEAAADLYAHADRIAALLIQADISSSQAPTEIRDVANWAAYRARDLHKRIDRIVATDHIGAGPTVRGFRFATVRDAVAAADDAADKLRKLLGKGTEKALGDELRNVAPYLADQRFAAGLFKRVGPKGTFDLLSATQGRPEVVVVGRALAAAARSGAVSDKFLDGILEAAQKRAAALDAYVHSWGGVDERDRARVALDEYMHRAGSPPGTYKLLESTAPLVPYLESGTRVAIIGGAVVIVASGAACVALSAGSCLGPDAAFVAEGAAVFSSEDPSLPTGLVETLPLSLDDEATFTRFIDAFRAALPRAQLAFRGSSATGVSWKTGEPFDAESDLDLAVVDSDLFARADDLGLKLAGGGTRTPPLMPLQEKALGLAELAAALGDISGHPVKFMIYRTMDDVLSRGPAIVVPAP